MSDPMPLTSSLPSPSSSSRSSPFSPSSPSSSRRRFHRRPRTTPHSASRTPHSEKEVVIIGGGVAGLAAAYRFIELRRNGRVNVRVNICEASATLGGSIRTLKEHGCLMESGPDSMITDKPWGVDLCRRLGLEDQLVGTDPRYRRSFVVHRGKLVPIPEGFYMMAPLNWKAFLSTPLLSPRGKARGAWEYFVSKRRETGDESVGQFVRRRFGRELFDHLAEPLLGGIYATDPDELSLQATFPKFQEWEREFGSVIKGMRARMGQNRTNGNGATGGSSHRDTSLQNPSQREPRGTPEGSGISGPRYGLFVSLRGGMASLVDALARALPKGSIHANTAVSHLERLPDKRWKVVMEGGKFFEAHAVILAAPPYAASRLVHRFDPYLAQELDGIPYGSTATVNLVYRRRQIPHALDGFGFVCPAVERRTLVGCTFSSVKFPHRTPQGWVVLRGFLGEASTLIGRSNEEMAAGMMGELKELLGVTTVPSFTWVNRHDRSMPRYRVGHLDRLRRIEEGLVRLPGLALAGNGYRGIGLPDCIHSGEQAAESIERALTEVKRA